MFRTRAFLAAMGISVLTAAIFISPKNHHDSSRWNASREKLLSAYSKLPITFIENKGQADPSVRFYAQGPKFTFQLTPREVKLWLVTEQPPSVRPAAMSSGTSLGLRFAGANPDVEIVGEDRAAGEVNYFRGNNSSQWRTGVSHYRQVVYRHLWPGIDLRLREAGGSLKYEFVLQPGARVSDIRLSYTGADKLELNAQGELLIGTPAGILRDTPPVAYQEIGSVRMPVSSSYQVADDSYGFSTGYYDPERELILDPGLDYSTYLGGSAHEYGASIAIDSAGNAYVTGITQSPDFPTTAGAFDRSGSATNNLDVFVAKINPTGSALVYSTFIGGGAFDWGRAIAVDAAGNAYVAGQTRSSSFPTTSNAFDRTFNVANCPRCGIDTEDAFVLKLNASGSGLVYSTFLGGFDFDDAIGIAVDSAGSAYVTGETGSSNFPTTAGAFRTTKIAAFDAFVTKLNPAGSALVYSTYLGGAEVDYGQQIVVDKDGTNNAYVMGATRSPDFPTTAGAFNTTNNGMFDVFVAKLNANGSALLYSTFLGGSDMDSGGGLAVDLAGNAYVAGGTSSLNFPTTPGVLDTTPSGNDAFITKINPSGSGLVFSTLLGGSDVDGISAIALDATGKMFIGGTTGSTDWPTTEGAFDTTFNGGVVDGFVAVVSADASALLYSTFLGGSASAEGVIDLALDAAGSVYVTGQTMSPDFPTTAGALDRTFSGDPMIFWCDAFVAKITPTTGPPPPAALSSVSANPASVVGGNGSTGTVTLTGAAPSGGVTVALASNNAVASVPASVSISQGSTSTTFAISTTAVAGNTTATLTASYNGVTKTGSVTVTPVPAPASLQALSVNPSSVTGGTSSQGTITLTSAAPTGGLLVGISINNAAASVPGTITIAQGATSGTFGINTTTVTAATTAMITASAASVSRTASLTINPAPAAPTLTVTATGRSGERITSTPTGINVNVGSTGSASFPAGTSITLRSTNSRDVIWSGACSSGGNKVKTCTFTLTTNASVTGNVR